MRVPLLLPLLAALTACNNDYQVVAEEGELLLSPAFHDLGLIAVGTTASAEVALLAPKGRVKVLAVEVQNMEGDAFTAEYGDLSEITDEAPGVLELVYAPSSEGYHWARVTVITDEDNPEHELEVRGGAAEPRVRVLPPLVDFGPLDGGETGSARVTLINLSPVALRLTDLDFAESTFTSPESLPLDMGANEELELSLAVISTGSEAAGALSLTFAGQVDAPEVWLQVNACSDPVGALYDADGDGYSVCATDCDDGDASSNPGQVEVCDGADNDCDGTIDEGTSCYDDDGDGYTEDEGDCNDAEPAMNPGEAEIYDNGMDDDCDGVMDHGEGDDDGDGYASWAGDCDDADPSVYPGAPETADGDDDDCDGTIDEGTSAYDDDGDGVTEDGGDCDDADNTVYPGSTEAADGVDDDCDGIVDEGTNRYDDDGDGYTEIGGDCDDTDANVSPAEREVTGNGKDDDCDGVSS